MVLVSSPWWFSGGRYYQQQGLLAPEHSSPQYNRFFLRLPNSFLLTFYNLRSVLKMLQISKILYFQLCMGSCFLVFPPKCSKSSPMQSPALDVWSHSWQLHRLWCWAKQLQLCFNLLKRLGDEVMTEKELKICQNTWKSWLFKTALGKVSLQMM